MSLPVSLSLLTATLESTADGILVVDDLGNVVGRNSKFAEMWQVPDEVLATCHGRSLLEHAAALVRDPHAFRDRLAAVYADPDCVVEDEVDLHDGRVFSRFSQPQRVDGRVVGRVWSFRDRTAERQLEQELRRMAYYDELTGLANRALFMQRGRAMADRAAATGAPLAVAVLDMDTLKLVNDELGHQAGDELLRTLASRLVAVVRPGDLVARLGGDEFGVLLPDADAEAALALTERMVDAMAAPVVLTGRAVQASLSGGSSAATGDVELERLLHQADLAMYRAKSDGRGRARGYDAEVSRADPRATAVEVTRLLSDPRALVTVLQPICDLRTGALVGHESLTRFPGRQHREVGEWFAVARAAGHGPALEARAIRVARRHHAAVTAEAEAALAPGGATGARPGAAYLTVNVSPVVLGSPDVQEALAGDLSGVVVEVTEDSRLDLGELARLLADLRTRGARVAMDDTGAGYDGLRRLVVLRPEIVKLDRHLVHEVHVHPEKRAMVEAMVSFCRQTGSTLCAEGIESEAELRTLVELGVELGQGWFVGRPAEGRPEVSAAAAAACGALPTVTVGDLGPLRRRLDLARTRFDIALVVQRCLPALGADDTALSVVEGDLLVVAEPPGWHNRSNCFDLRDYPTTREALTSGRPFAVRTDDPAADPGELRVLREMGYGSVVLLPLMSDGRGIGALEVYAQAVRAWSDREMRLLAVLAEEVADALDRVERGVMPR